MDADAWNITLEVIIYGHSIAMSDDSNVIAAYSPHSSSYDQNISSSSSDNPDILLDHVECIIIMDTNDIWDRVGSATNGTEIRASFGSHQRRVGNIYAIEAPIWQQQRWR